MTRKSKNITAIIKEKVPPEYFNMVLLATIAQHYERIEDRLKALESKVDKLIQEFKMNNLNSEEHVVVVQEIPYNEAKKMVVEYFKQHGEATIVELHHNLGIKIDTLIEILDELSGEGIIG